ncbi:MAG: class D sortase [Woeseiaceae bacterium]|nr:class D sortase [Woeseiaceae bacterium]
MKPQNHAASFAERLLWALAVLCLLPLGVTTAARHLAASTKLELSPSDAVAFELPSIAEKQPSQVLWSQTRRSEFARLKDLFHRAEIARLEFPTLDVIVPVFAGDDEVSMTLGAGHLSDTSSVQGHGNIAITSHRDGAFRVLKDLETGDRILLQTPSGTRDFRIARRLIVNPDQVDVIAPTSDTTLTLITCYPFYFVGKAPQRFIIQAELVTPESADSMTDAPLVQRLPTLRNRGKRYEKAI